MPIDYSSLLSDSQKRSILQQRVQQFAAEAYQHEINRKLATETGNEAGVAQADEALTILDQAISLHLEELEKLGPSDVSE